MTSRPGEALDVAAVDAWLRERVADLGAGPAVTQYSGGASNWTYRLAYERRDLVLRRPPAGTKARTAHDMGREHRVQAALQDVFPYVPRMVARCDDDSIIGCEFYVMERVGGVIPRKHLGVELTPSQTRALCERFVDTLVELHAVDVTRPDIAALGKGDGYARRQVEGWRDRYRKARTWNAPTYERVIAWLEPRIPDDAATCVVHNDFRLDNVVLDPSAPTRVAAVLDWEMATLGDPLMDLGNTLAYWVQADDDPVGRALRRQPTHLPGMLTRDELVERYFARSGRPRVDVTFYQVFGMFRLAVIAQQIYLRYFKKETRNPAFKHLYLASHYLHWRCLRLLKTAR